MKHAMPKQRAGLKTRIAIAGLSIALPCAFLGGLPASPKDPSPVEYPYILTAAISQTSTTVGISAFDLSTSTPEKVNSTLDLLQGLGVTDIRISIPWSQIESSPGAYDWTGLDTIVNAAAARNLGVVGILEKTPAWAVRFGQPALSGPPRSPALLGNFASTVATRYTGKIAAYEVYNEPNLALAFSTLSPTDYTALLKAVYPAVKAADPSALVIGGVVGSTPEINFLTVAPDSFIQGIYAAGGQGYFDALSFHPYNYGLRFSQTATIPNNALFQLAAIRALMVANGDTDKQIWLTEYGAPSSTNGEGQQAALIADLLNTWKTLPYAGPVFIHTAIDRATGSSSAEDTFGIFTSSLTAKLAAQIVQQAIAGTLPTTSDPVATESAAIASALFVNSLAATWNVLTAPLKAFVDAFNNFVNGMIQAMTSLAATPAPIMSATTFAASSSVAAEPAEPSQTGAAAQVKGQQASDSGLARQNAELGSTESTTPKAKADAATTDAVTSPAAVTSTDGTASASAEVAVEPTAGESSGSTTGSSTTGSSTTGSSTTGSTTTGSTTTGSTTTGSSTTGSSTTGSSTTGSTTTGSTTTGSSATGKTKTATSKTDTTTGGGGASNSGASTSSAGSASSGGEK